LTFNSNTSPTFTMSSSSTTPPSLTTAEMEQIQELVDQSESKTQCILRVQKNGFFSTRSFTLLIDDQEILKAKRASLFQTGSFAFQSRDRDPTLIRKNFNTLPLDIEQSAPWDTAGEMNSPGILYDSSMVHDAQQNMVATVIYDNTSRTGDLMNMKVVIPRVVKQGATRLKKIISTQTSIPSDCAQIIVDYLDLLRAERIPKSSVRSRNCHKLIGERFHKQVRILTNKRPRWNAQINAFTLEFGGRARVPSVHNFQLVDEDDDVKLQLGKSTASEYNLDFSYPLTPYQAFCAAISVIDRTFVWD